MKKIIVILYLLCITVLTVACSSNDGETQEPIPPPKAASLLFPNNNEICNEGTIISNTESSVVFKWTAAENADSYTIDLLNLGTNVTNSLTANTNELAITILRGASYSWSVTSKANGTIDTAKSSQWNFYNAGLPVESHVPFPANVISPPMGSSTNAGEITLKWKGSDVDDDITTYDVYMDTNNPPNTKIETTTEDATVITITSGNTYYWKITTYDSAENTSNSEIFQFKAN